MKHLIMAVVLLFACSSSYAEEKKKLASYYEASGKVVQILNDSLVCALIPKSERTVFSVNRWLYTDPLKEKFTDGRSVKPYPEEQHILIAVNSSSNLYDGVTFKSLLVFDRIVKREDAEGVTRTMRQFRLLTNQELKEVARYYEHKFLFDRFVTDSIFYKN